MADEVKPAYIPGQPWPKGMSGNPSGKPKDQRELFGKARDFARQHTEAAINTLVKIMGDEEAPHASRVAAANYLLDRGWGRPAQAIIGGEEDDPPIQVSEIVIRAVNAASDRSADESDADARPAAD